jgi:hypothetical protein
MAEALKEKNVKKISKKNNLINSDVGDDVTKVEKISKKNNLINSDVGDDVTEVKKISKKYNLINSNIEDDATKVLKRNKHYCIECSVSGARMTSLTKLYLCGSCKLLDKYKLIYLTTAKTEYFLKEEELDGLSTWHTKNSYGVICTLYCLVDIIHVFCLKYKINNDLEAVQEKRNELLLIKENRKREKIKRAEEKQEQFERKRKIVLMEELNKFGLELRSDSSLCAGYIYGTIDDKYNLEQIVKRMCQMKYLFEYCNMDKYLEEVREEHNRIYEAGYYPDGTMFEVAENMALEKHGENKKYPETWPWLEFKNIKGIVINQS